MVLYLTMSLNEKNLNAKLNALGMIVKTVESNELKYNRSITINLSDLDAGIYFIKTTINSLSYDYKVIKQ